MPLCKTSARHPLSLARCAIQFWWWEFWICLFLLGYALLIPITSGPIRSGSSRRIMWLGIMRLGLIWLVADAVWMTVMFRMID